MAQHSNPASGGWLTNAEELTNTKVGNQRQHKSQVSKLSSGALCFIPDTYIKSCRMLCGLIPAVAKA